MVISKNDDLLAHDCTKLVDAVILIWTKIEIQNYFCSIRTTSEYIEPGIVVLFKRQMIQNLSKFVVKSYVSNIEYDRLNFNNLSLTI